MYTQLVLTSLLPILALSELVLPSTIPQSKDSPASTLDARTNLADFGPTEAMNIEAQNFVVEFPAVNFNSPIWTFNPAQVTTNACQDRKVCVPMFPWNGKTTDIDCKHSILLGNNISCDIYSELGCKGSVTRNVSNKARALIDSKHRDWVDAGFAGDRRGPMSWQCYSNKV